MKSNYQLDGEHTLGGGYTLTGKKEVDRFRLGLISRGINLEIMGLKRMGRPCSAIARDILRSKGLAAPRKLVPLLAAFNAMIVEGEDHEN